MKYLAIANIKDTAITLPITVLVQIMEATIAHMEQHVKAGKIQEGYFVPGWNRFVVISENESIEELYKNQSENPMYGLLNIELYPLTDINESMKIMLEGLKRAPGASK